MCESPCGAIKRDIQYHLCGAVTSHAVYSGTVGDIVIAVTRVRRNVPDYIICDY